MEGAFASVPSDDDLSGRPVRRAFGTIVIRSSISARTAEFEMLVASADTSSPWSTVDDSSHEW